MTMLRPIDGGWIDSRIPDILRRIRVVDPLLTIAAECRKGGTVKNYTVLRCLPSGQPVEFVGRWEPHEVELIEGEIRTLDRTLRGHEDSIAKIVKGENAREKKNSEEFAAVYQEMLEHGTHEANADRGAEKTFFGEIPGRKAD